MPDSLVCSRSPPAVTKRWWSNTANGSAATGCREVPGGAVSRLVTVVAPPLGLHLARAGHPLPFAGHEARRDQLAQVQPSGVGKDGSDAGLSAEAADSTS